MIWGIRPKGRIMSNPEIRTYAYDPVTILESGATKEKKIIMLWLIMQLDYRGPVGEKAVEALKALIPDADIMGAFMQIVGFASAKPTPAVLESTYREMAQGVFY